MFAQDREEPRQMEPHRQRARLGHDRAIYRPLPRSFYARPVHVVARALLGALLVRRVAGGLVIARIVETEAYGGLVDPSSHSFRGETARCATMFGPVGRLYVYFTYGAHFCVNVVAGSRRAATAVLLRAAEAVDGAGRSGPFNLEQMRRGRLARSRPGATAERLARGELDGRLASGPGNLAAAFSFDRSQDGIDLTRAGDAWLAAGDPPARVRWTPRIGLSSPLASRWLWRCIDAASAAATRVPPDWPSSPRPTPSLAAARRAVARARAHGE
jgi:DNA-3-methyladenine glycosylase